MIVGTSFPYMQCLPKPDQAKAVQIDRDPTRIGLRYPVDIGLAGDAKATLQALLAAACSAKTGPLVPGDGPGADEGMVGADARPRETRDDVPLKPQVVARHVNDLLADNAIITTDSGTITTWAARHIKIRRGMKFSCSGNLATMAPGLPYANRRPDRLSRPPGRRLRGRRRLHHADGRVRHGGQAQPADQGRRSSRTTRSARSSGSRWSSWAIPNTASSCSRSTS